MIREGVGRVKPVRELGNALVVLREVPNSAAFVLRIGPIGIEEIAAPIEQPIKVIKATMVRMVDLVSTKMPFARQ